jgi:hypothetical protein
MRSTHFPECARDCQADERGILIAPASPAHEDDYDDPLWYGYFAHDTIGATYEGETCYGAAFEVLAEGDNRAEVERVIFWTEIRSELEAVANAIDLRGIGSLRAYVGDFWRQTVTL